MRKNEFLKHSYAAILSSIGFILILSGFVMLTPLLLLITDTSEISRTLHFVLPALLMILAGTALRRWFKVSPKITLSVHEGGIIVIAGWTLVIIASAMPFMTILGLSFSNAVFESMSGWTTTGLSVVDVTSAGPMVLLWRSIIQLAGGAGLAIIMMSAITGPTGAGISNAEGRGDQLVPHVRQSARLVMIIYTCYAAAGTLAYWLVGMTLFDAVNHSFAAVSTGGFSTRPESIGFWNSAAVEAVSIPLMILGNLSFVTAWYLFRGDLKTVSRNGEVRLMAIVIPLFTATLFLVTSQSLYPHLGKAFRVALFETVSALTTTGFSSVSYSNWNSIGIFSLTLLMLIGGGTCSTAGGIKQFRIYLICKMLVWDIKHYLMPQSAIQENSIWEGNRRVSFTSEKLRPIAVFVFLYLGTFAVGVMILCAYGFSLGDSMFEFASALGTAGLSVGVTTAKMPLIALWTETVAMFLGRLEFIVIIISVIKFGSDAGFALSCRDKDQS